MVAPLTLYVIRHGEVHNPDEILYGRMPGFGLSDAGRGQASAAAASLAEYKLDAIYASPMQRAQETASIIANMQQTFMSVETDKRLNEVHTPYEGTHHSELEKTNFDIYTGVQPPYEQPHDIRRRVQAYIATMREGHAGEQIAAITHGDLVISFFLIAKSYQANDMARLELQNLGLPEPYPATASISRLVFHTQDPQEVPEYHYIKPY